MSITTANGTTTKLTPQQTKDAFAIGAGAVGILLLQVGAELGAAAAVGAYVDKERPKRGAMIGVASIVAGNVAGAVVNMTGGLLLREQIRKSSIAQMVGARLRTKIQKNRQ